MEFSAKPEFKYYILAMTAIAFVVIACSSSGVVCTNPKNHSNISTETSEEIEENPIHHEVQGGRVEEAGGGRPEEYYPAGSSLPDCSHACGPCFPCKRVLVSFKCSMSESCPIVYRCTCKGKFYHIPSAH